MEISPQKRKLRRKSNYRRLTVQLNSRVSPSISSFGRSIFDRCPLSFNQRRVISISHQVIIFIGMLEVSSIEVLNPLHSTYSAIYICGARASHHWLPYFLLAVMPPAAVSAHDDVVVEVAIVEEAVGGESLSRCSPLLFPCLSFLLSFYSMRCLFIGVSSCCSNQVRFHFHQFHPTFLSYYTCSAVSDMKKHYSALQISNKDFDKPFS